MISFAYRFAAVTGLFVLTAATLTPARAQDRDDLNRGAVHVVWMNGAVSVRHGDDGPWVAAVLDAPLANGDHIATGAKAQADIQLDDANVFHAGSNSEIRLDRLESGHYRMAVIRGAVTCHVGGSSTADVEVGTPSVAVRPSKPGVYLIAVSRAGESEITVRAGDVEVVAPRGSEWVNAGQKMVARGPASDPQYKIGHAVPLWRRVAVVVANCVQIADMITSSLPAGGGATHNSSGATKTTAGPAKPAAPSAPARPTAPSPPPHDGNRGKG
ncbi:MAG: FecR domain-containing protein [Acidobacteriia bacterium]|nr:FecR domain-containing protein [Terriglobia bacterium]